MLQVIQATTAIIGVVITTLIFFHYKLQRDDSWLQQFSTVHDAFWRDEDLPRVRAWIANDKAYEEVGRVLEKRRNDPDNVTVKEYEHLEHLDKFLSLLVRLRHLPTGTAAHKLRARLFDDYWLNAILEARDERSLRHHLFWYAERFYPDLFLEELPHAQLLPVSR